MSVRVYVCEVVGGGVNSAREMSGAPWSRCFFIGGEEERD